jgi:hypothetical protein
MRLIAIGRSNWLFARALTAGKRATLGGFEKLDFGSRQTSRTR